MCNVVMTSDNAGLTRSQEPGAGQRSNSHQDVPRSDTADTLPAPSPGPSTHFSYIKYQSVIVIIIHPAAQYKKVLCGVAILCNVDTTMCLIMLSNFL